MLEHVYELSEEFGSPDELASFGRGILTAGDILWSHPTR